MNEDVDYTNLADIAKLNLSNIINKKNKEYKNSPNKELKKELIKLLQDRDAIFAFDIDVIKKYL